MQKITEITFKQTIWGSCYLVCLANIFGHFSLISNLTKEFCEDGFNIFQVNKFLESKSYSWSLFVDRKDPDGLSKYQLRNYYSPEYGKGNLLVALSVVPSKKEGHFHQIAILIGEDYCILLDPLLDFVYKGDIGEISDRYGKVISMEFLHHTEKVENLFITRHHSLIKTTI